MKDQVGQMIKKIIAEYWCPALIISPIVKIFNHKAVLLECIHIFSPVKSVEIALHHASLNISLRPFQFSLLSDEFIILLYTILEQSDAE